MCRTAATSSGCNLIHKRATNKLDTVQPSSFRYNRRSGLLLCCPMTRQKKGYPFEVVIGPETDRESVVLADQVKSLDWKVRKAVKKGSTSIEVVAETLSKLQTLL